MRVQEIKKIIYPRISYSPRALPSGNMILLGESIFIFPSPACNECIIWNHRYQNSIHFYCQPVWSYSKIREITIVITVTYVMKRRLNNEPICTCTLCNVIKFVAVSRFFANYVCTLLIYTPIDVKYTVINNIFRHVGSLVDRYGISVSQMTTYMFHLS